MVFAAGEKGELAQIIPNEDTLRDGVYPAPAVHEIMPKNCIAPLKRFFKKF